MASYSSGKQSHANIFPYSWHCCSLCLLRNGYNQTQTQTQTKQPNWKALCNNLYGITERKDTRQMQLHSNSQWPCKPCNKDTVVVKTTLCNFANFPHLFFLHRRCTSMPAQLFMCLLCRYAHSESNKRELNEATVLEIFFVVNATSILLCKVCCWNTRGATAGFYWKNAS